MARFAPRTASLRRRVHEGSGRTVLGTGLLEMMDKWPGKWHRVPCPLIHHPHRPDDGDDPPRLPSLRHEKEPVQERTSGIMEGARR